MQTVGDMRVIHRKTVKGTKESKNQKTYNNELLVRFFYFK